MPILALTGSNGKTTVKEMLRTILEAHVRADAPRVLATAGNFNNHIGVPLMLARLNADHAYAVLETGMNHFGEIRTLTHLIKPHVALINNAGPAHLEGVGDLDGVARAKGELLEGLAADGSAVLNADDVYFAFWREKLAQGQTLISFGTSANADVRGQWADVAVGAPIEVTIHSDMATLRLPLAGAHNRMNALAAIAGAHALGVPLTTAVTALSGFSSVAGRQRVLAGLAGATIIDDSYNANPASVRAAIDSLVTRSGRRFLALGPLAELGAESDALHRILGESIARSAVDDFYAVGEPMRGAVEACNRIAPKARWFLNKAALVKALRPHLATTVTVLVKGSRSSAMEEVVTQIIEKKNSEVETPACS